MNILNISFHKGCQKMSSFSYLVKNCPCEDQRLRIPDLDVQEMNLPTQMLLCFRANTFVLRNKISDLVPCRISDPVPCRRSDPVPCRIPPDFLFLLGTYLHVK